VRLKGELSRLPIHVNRHISVRHNKQQYEDNFYIKTNMTISIGLCLKLSRRLMCRSKEDSSLPISSSASINMSHAWAQRVDEDIWDGAAKRACGKGAVDSQHGTGVAGILHPCTKGQPSQVSDFFCFKPPHIC
jgi:hypothetical protein